MVLFPGNGDFTPPVASLQRSGRRVSVISTLIPDPPIVPDDLRRQAGRLMDLEDLRDKICPGAGGDP